MFRSGIRRVGPFAVTGLMIMFDTCTLYNDRGYEYERTNPAPAARRFLAPRPRPHRTCNLRTSLGNERDSDFTFLCGSARGSRLELRAFPAGSRGRLSTAGLLVGLSVSRLSRVPGLGGTECLAFKPRSMSRVRVGQASLRARLARPRPPRDAPALRGHTHTAY